MAQTTETTAAVDRSRGEKPALPEMIGNFVHKARYVLWSLLGALVALLVGYFVYVEVDKNRREQAAVLVEEAAEQLDTWKAAEAGTAKDEKKAALTEKLDLIVRKYPRQHGAQKARLLRATMLVAEEKWELAAKEFLALADAFPKSYLAPLALSNAGAAMENALDESGAMEAYGRLIQAYPASYLAPQALYSRGRLYEAAGDLEKAKADYTTLADNHTSSNWTRLAKNRILALQIKGR